MDKRIFNYPDALLADFSIEINDPQKQPEAKWHQLCASQLP